MKLLLDENITKEALFVFKNLGYDVVSIKSLGFCGVDDMVVFTEAIRQNRVLITQNGKDFIVQVPPRMAGISHEGLFWLKYDFTRGLAEVICNEFDQFITSVRSIADEIWLHENNGGKRKFTRTYP